MIENKMGFKAMRVTVQQSTHGFISHQKSSHKPDGNISKPRGKATENDAKPGFTFFPQLSSITIVKV